jgi:hypothetical protein
MAERYPVAGQPMDLATMTESEDREKGEDARFAVEADTAFRIAARRNRLLAHWAAEQMGLTPEETEAYSKAVIQSEFEEAGDKDAILRVLGDLTAAGCDLDEAAVRAVFDEKEVEARRHFMSES